MEGIEKSATRNDVTEHGQEIVALKNFSKTINAILSENDLFQSVIEQILDIVVPDMTVIFLRRGSKLIPVNRGPESLPMPMAEEYLCRLSVKEKKPVFVKSIRHDPRCFCEDCKKSGYSSFATLPLKVKNEVLGVLAMASVAERDFSIQRNFLEALVNEVSVGYRNILLFRKLEKRTRDLESRTQELLRVQTAQQEAKQRLRANQRMLQLVFDGISAPLLLVDKSFRVKILNQAARKYYQLDPTMEIGGETCHWLLKNAAVPCQGCKVQQIIKNAKPATYERKGVISPERIEKVSVYPINKANGEEDGCVIQIDDITDEKRVEQELQQADKMISLGVLVSGVAHEINNPNNWIMLNTPILQDSWESLLPILDAYHAKHGDFVAGGLPYQDLREAVPQLLNGILGGSKRIMRIVKDLKSYARYQPDDSRAPVDINKILAAAVALAANQIKDATNAFEVEYGQDLPIIQGDWQKIEQVILNLIQNACQAINGKQSRISVKSFIDKQHGMVAVSVADEGPGISEKILPRIMDPFFTTKRDMGGVGLGLSVSSKIIQDHGGRLNVMSQPGNGTIFTMLLPWEQRTSKVNVLVADDDAIVRDLVSLSLLKKKRYVVKEATTGTEACLMLGHAPPDVLILDIGMPDMDGLEVCRQIKKTPTLQGVKVIVITGNPESDKARAMINMGFKVILPKPFSPKTLVDTLEATVFENEYMPHTD